MTRDPLALAVAQPAVVAGDLGATVRAHAEAVRTAEARVVAFPELSLTGYHLDAPVVDPDDPALLPLVEACAEAGALALVGAPVPGEHIGVLAVAGDGVRVAYRKVWLGDDEARRFRSGPGPAVVEVDGWRLGLAVCRDTRFPEHDEATAARGMDVYVAGVVHHAGVPEVAGERARRVPADRGVWVATACFAGPTGEGFDATTGTSSIWSPEGEVVAAAGPDPGDLAVAVLR